MIHRESAFEVARLPLDILRPSYPGLHSLEWYERYLRGLREQPEREHLPIAAEFVDDVGVVIDGVHRFQAYRGAGRESIVCLIVKQPGK